MGVLVLLLCLAVGASAWAEEDSATGTDEAAANPEETDSGVPSRTETAEDGEDSEDGTAEDESPDVFIPSENISENISVKFPVDI